MNKGKPIFLMNSSRALPMKYIVKAICGILLFFLMSGLVNASQPLKNHKVVYVGMILARGGLGDRSFNDSAYAGLQEAQRKFGIQFDTISHTSKEANLKELRRLIRQEYDLIIGIGYENAKYIENIAKDASGCKLAIVDVPSKADNVASIVFREQEGDFLMGVLAVMLTESNKVGFIGGMDIGIIRRIETGFRQGVAHEDRSVEVISDIAGTFAKPKIGKSLALAQYELGVDVIYNAAGRTGLGIIEAAKEKDRLTIGTSGDQRYLAPGNVVGNRPKRVDKAVLMLVDTLINGQFAPGVHSLGLEEGGLSLGPFDEKLVTEPMLERLEDLKQKIIKGELVVEPVEGE